jgi:hypothetical protein
MAAKRCLRAPTADSLLFEADRHILREAVLLADSVGAYGAALIAAVSAVVGGLLTVGSNVLIEERRRKHAAEVARAAEQVELRRATRLILAELVEVTHTIRHVARSRSGWPSERRLPASAWDENRGVLAARMPLVTWRWVCTAYDLANEVNLQVVEREGHMTNDADVEWLRQPFRTAYRAMEELEHALGESEDPWYSYRGERSMEELEAEAFGAQELNR